jgi:peptidoglycan hydrolase CwlO-like protein
MVLVTAANKASEAEVGFRNEIERLEQLIAIAVASAKDPTTNQQQLNRGVQSLDNQIDSIRASQARAVSEIEAESRREIERLEWQIDDLLAAAKP